MTTQYELNPPAANASPEWIATLRELYEIEDRKIYLPERKRSYQQKYRTMVSKTDPDAPLVTHDPGNARGKARPRYKHHRVVDDARGVVTAIETTGTHIHVDRLL